VARSRAWAKRRSRQCWSLRVGGQARVSLARARISRAGRWASPMRIGWWRRHVSTTHESGRAGGTKTWKLRDLLNVPWADRMPARPTAAARSSGAPDRGHLNVHALGGFVLTAAWLVLGAAYRPLAVARWGGLQGGGALQWRNEMAMATQLMWLPVLFLCAKRGRDMHRWCNSLAGERLDACSWCAMMPPMPAACWRDPRSAARARRHGSRAQGLRGYLW